MESKRETVIVAAPPSKSVSHRMLIGAALAAGDSVVEHVLESRDIERTADILRAAGARIERQGDGKFAVSGVAGTPAGGFDAPVSCDVHESGTTCRLLTAVLAAGKGMFRIHGAPRMHERPIGELVDVLRGRGVRVTYEGREGCPPLLIDSDGMSGGATAIGLGESSQYLSGLLLAAPLTSGLTIEVSGDKVVSWPYVALTLQALEDFGIGFRVETRETPRGKWQADDWRTLREVRPGLVRFVVSPGVYRAGNYRVEGDWSNASYFLAAGAVGPRPVRVAGLRVDSLQGDRAMLDILGRMGARFERADNGVVVAPSSLTGVEVDMGHCPDLVPTVAATAAFAQGVTTIRNVAHLRIKECDRLSAPAAELRKAGVRVEELDDGLIVHGSLRSGGPAPVIDEKVMPFLSYGDHRMAMSLALLGFAGVQVALDDPACVAKSFPHFWNEWEKVRA
ncbi:MAG TPA: 3-phosphoshikimate 1-carboxyvinyltransferase [Nitratidesulfovibrio sp.]|nr:3-phosphoshikimate 1-carboxyvinyltransferase [Nitratidesulfovibrio sp.]